MAVVPTKEKATMAKEEKKAFFVGWGYTAAAAPVTLRRKEWQARKRENTVQDTY